MCDLGQFVRGHFCITDAVQRSFNVQQKRFTLHCNWQGQTGMVSQSFTMPRCYAVGCSAAQLACTRHIWPVRDNAQPSQSSPTLPVSLAMPCKVAACSAFFTNKACMQVYRFDGCFGTVNIVVRHLSKHSATPKSTKILYAAGVSIS